MAGKRRAATAAAPRGAARGVVLGAQTANRETRQTRRTTRSQADHHALPTVYRELLAEVGIGATSTSEESPERPFKRPRTGRRPPALLAAEAEKAPQNQDGGDHDSKSAEAAEGSDEEDIELVDVAIPEPKVQTIELSSEEDSDGEDEEIEFEDVDIAAIVAQRGPVDRDTGTLQLNLTAAEQALAPTRRTRKQPLSKEEKQRRVEIHQMHLLCLLAHVEKRNHWCNDPVTQETLRPLLSDKTIRFLNPPASLNQFGQTESLKRGLKEAQDVFRHKFRVTECGLRRALWAEDQADLQHYERPRNLDGCLDKVDFRKAAQQLRGSRDVAAQLFCALLRAVGVEARLVCSLQPLSFVPGGPTLPKPRKIKTPTKQPSQTARAVDAVQAPSFPAIPSPRARLGHPHAAAYRIPSIPAPPPSASMPLPGPGLVLQESPFPVYWTEVLDVAHQKWQPVDAIVTGLHFRPHRLEPPALDRNNILTYAVAFEDDGAAKDVTRRYAKAINSKTRRLRIDGPSVPSSVEGAKWWRRALRRYRPSRVGPLSDLDQIEETELNAAEAREPMPRNVADFKDHPVYALERHLRRHEVLIPGAQVVGTVGAGSKGPLEKIYRRRDVRIARTREKWYRVGRIIKPGEEPVKVVPKRKPAKSTKRLHLEARDLEGANRSSSDDEEDDPVLGYNPAKGNPLYTFDQTELYVPPMVVGGRIPKNIYGNVDVYVPSMVPIGGVHVKHPRAAHAAIILGVDYAPALQGFEFKGRSGTAVYNGVVVPAEAADGIRVVLKGLEEWEEEVKRQERRLRVLEKWRDWERTLRIRKRVFWDAKGEDNGGYWDGLEVSQFVKEGEAGGEILLESEEDEAVPRGYGAVGVAVLHGGDDGGGGFEPGGFEPEYTGSGGFEPGGFETEIAEPGGFEVSHHQQLAQAEASYSFSVGFEDGEQDEGKESAPSAPGTSIQEDMMASTGEVDLGKTDLAQDGSSSSSRQDKGRAEVIAEEEQSQASDSPAPTRQNDAALLGSVAQPVAATILTDSEQQQQQQQVLETDQNGNVPTKDAPAASARPPPPQEHVGSQMDTEDGASETTEELFMDEDGALLE